MAKETLDQNLIQFRPAQPEDAKAASRLLFETFPQKATFVIGLGDEERAQRILRKLFEEPDHRLSYTETELAIYQGRIIGLITAFPGREMGRLDRRLDLLILKQYNLKGKIVVIQRGWPLIFIKETTRKEFFISNLAVKRRFRSKGLGEQLLSRVEAIAVEAKMDRLSLMVAIENQRARQFYDRHGFRTSAIHLESNQRVQYLGAGYQRMIKTLGK